MTGEILDMLNVRPGEQVTQETLETAKKLWMEIYLFFMLLVAHTNPIKRQQLEDMRTKLAEVNELITSLKI